MEKLIAGIATTLKEESRLFERMIDLAAEVRSAILERSPRKLLLLSTKQQNAFVQLEIIRQSQSGLAANLAARLGLPEGNVPGLATMLRGAGREEEATLAERLRQAVSRLREMNLDNRRLMEKQLHSMELFHKVLNLVGGAEALYDSGGAVRDLEGPRRIEQTG